MNHIEEFLTHFDDQHLANLQCAAEDGRLVYRDPCNCLVHHFAGSYSETKWHPEIGLLARQAEQQFFYLPRQLEERELRYPLSSTIATMDHIRRPALLALIHAEWGRRAQEKMAQQINEIEELQPVSPNLR